MYDALSSIDNFVKSIAFIYTISIFSMYIFLAVVSAYGLIRYLREISFVNYREILSYPNVPSISIIAPAYNESVSVVENVRGLLSLYYNKFEVILVNDGSTDGTLEKVIEAYDLEKVDYAINERLKTEKIRGVYKSTDPSFSQLIVVDKENGGKADSLNAGINISNNDYFVSIDVDSIIESDCLLKLVKPFLDETERRVIATGGVIRIANSCKIEGGQVVEVRVPKGFIARAQVLEYTRAFLMGRMAWSEFNGLLIISGALGMFDKEIAIKAGGYWNQTVGEDMEIIVRMRRYMHEQNEKYLVKYIPDPLCWTEVPENVDGLAKQRNRWTRGTMETLWRHKKLFFNPKYKNLGMLGYPFWFFFEWLSPVVEFIGVSLFILLIAFGTPNWAFFLLLLIFVYAFSVSFSAWALLFEVMSFHRYKKFSDILLLFSTAILEPFIYHPMITIFSIGGNIDYITGKKGWGKMKRKGFGGP